MGCICAVEEGSHHLAHSQQPNYQAQAVSHAMVTKAAVIAVPAGCNAPPFHCPIRTSCQKLPAWIRVSSSRGQLLAVIGATKGPFRRTQACPHTMTIWMTTFTMSAPALPNMFARRSAASAVSCCRLVLRSAATKLAKAGGHANAVVTSSEDKRRDCACSLAQYSRQDASIVPTCGVALSMVQIGGRSMFSSSRFFVWFM